MEAAASKKRQRNPKRPVEPDCVTLSDDDDDIIEVANEAPSGSSNSGGGGGVIRAYPADLKNFMQPRIVHIVKDAIKPGDRVYGIDRGLKHAWLEASVESLEKRYGKVMMKLKFDVPEKSLGRRKFKQERFVSNSHIAYFYPPKPEMLLTGLRIIARTKDDSPTGESFFAGTVAEPPSILNHHRALVFFDDGHAAYCPPDDIRMTASAEPGGSAWIECHPDMQEFIEGYVRLYPERIIKATLRKNAITAVDWNGSWWAGRVIDVDCSLAKVRLMANSFVMTIWRGSNRFYDVYIRTREAADRQWKSKPNIEYEGKVEMRRVPRALSYRPRDYVPHSCRKSCASVFGGHPESLKHVSPLALPMHHGWQREIETDTQSRPIVYIAPCGTKFYDLREIQKFLSKTYCPFGIDSFDFTFTLNCLEEFSIAWPSKRMIPDISNGQEWVPISLVNTVDYTSPIEVAYTIKRLPRPSVKINTNPDFLVCCDCTDDCVDKSKCACFQQTHEGVKKVFPLENYEDYSYQHRRLGRKCPTGIFECNSKCRCSHNCTNRVVQLGLKWKLQVFKTQSKGYAVRTLQDIPEGSFVTVYTGEILTSAEANEFGTAHGDEYLANIDFIEAAEKHKPGYEEDVVEPNSNPKYFMFEEVRKSKRGKKKAPKKSSKSKSKKAAEDEDIPLKTKTRLYYGKDEEVYAIDAKRIGNVGRYLNHSCDPNVYVQDVFIDTHDVRFPWIALFSLKFIKCGAELTWDYNYEVGMADSKSLACTCGSMYCRKQLL